MSDTNPFLDPEYLQNNVHPELDGSMPLGVMEDWLGENFYEQDSHLDKIGQAEEERMDELAIKVIMESAMTGDGDDIYDLAGFDRKLSSAQKYITSDMRKPSRLTGSVAERAKSMTEGERHRLKLLATQYVMQKMDLE